MRSAVALVFFLLTVPLPAADFTTVDREIERAMQAGGVPGAAIVIVHDGQVVHAKAFGVTSVETGVPVTTGTLFRLGSTTKLFLALAVLDLVDQGKLRLDQPAGEILTDLDPALKAITIRQLLTHTAGLADEAPMNGPLDESALHARVKSWTGAALFARPGEIFSYANTGYVLLGDVIAHATNQPFSAAIEALVLRPMGMSDSTFLPLAAMTRRLALGHDAKGVIRPFAEHAGNYPPGSLFTSADDAGRFLCALTARRLDQLTSFTVPIPAQGRRYGYGLIVDERRGPRVLLHTGARAGYGSTIAFLPSDHVAVAVLSNRSGATLSSAALEAINQYAKIVEPAGAVERLPLSVAEIDAIAGTYANGPRLPSVELTRSGEQLVVRFAGKQLPATRVGADRFHIDGGGQLETFVLVRDDNGAARFLCAETWALRKRS